MNTLLRVLVALLAAAACGAGHARQDPLAVQQAVEAFLRQQAQGLPGTATVSAGTLDPHNALAPCAALEPFLPAGSRAWGRVTVGVRCRAEAGWTVYVQARVKVEGEYYVTARALAPGHALAANDLVRRGGDLAELPPGVVTDPAQAIGHSLNFGLAAGKPLRADGLRRQPAIQAGQQVRVTSRGQGFQVSTEGRALANAGDGQVIQVRTASGQTVSGIARRNGVVEVSY